MAGPQYVERMDILRRIKRAVLAGQFGFSVKAYDELEANHITEQDVVESISNAQLIYKTIRSRSMDASIALRSFT